MYAALILLALAAPDAEPEKKKTDAVDILLLDLRAAEADKGEARVLQNVIASRLSRQDGLLLNTQVDLERMVELEAQKMALDCNAESCLAEVAGALGVRYVVFGELGRLGGTAALSMTLFDAERARPLLRQTMRGATTLELEPQLEPFVVEALSTLGFDVAESSPPPPSAEFVTGAVVAGGGVVGAIALGAVAFALDGSLDVKTASKADRDAAFFGGWFALVGSAASVVAAGAGVGLMVMAE